MHSRVKSKYIVHSFNYNFLYSLAIISFVLTITSEKWLPERFLRDSAYYSGRIGSSVSGYGDSFDTVVRFYNAIGLASNPILIAIFQWFFCIMCLAILEFKFPSVFTKRVPFIYAIVYVLLIPIFCSTYTKELLIMALVAILVSLFTNQRWYLGLIFVLFLIVGIFLRTYYLLILFCAVFFFIFIYKMKRYYIWGLPIVMSTVIVTLDIFTRIFSKGSAYGLASVRHILVTQSLFYANSSIVPPVLSKSLFNNLWSYTNAFQQMIFPIKLFNFSIYSIVSLLGPFFFSFFLLKVTSFNLKRKFLGLYALKCLLLAFFTIALIFEPDLGSYTRHCFPYLLLYILVEVADETLISKGDLGLATQKNPVRIGTNQSSI